MPRIRRGFIPVCFYESDINRKEGGKDDEPRLVSCARGGGSTYYLADNVLLTIMGQKPDPCHSLDLEKSLLTVD